MTTLTAVKPAEKRRHVRVALGVNLDINLKGAFFLCQSVLRVFAEKRSGTIVNVASLAAQRGGGLVGGSHYAASKGGMLSLTKSIAREFGALGITVPRMLLVKNALRASLSSENRTALPNFPSTSSAVPLPLGAVNLRSSIVAMIGPSAGAAKATAAGTATSAKRSRVTISPSADDALW